MRPARAWALLWRSNNKLNGETKHLVMEGCVPALFRTRSIARDYAKGKYGYIAARDDLRVAAAGIWSCSGALCRIYENQERMRG